MSHRMVPCIAKTVRRLSDDDEDEVYDASYKQMIDDDMEAGARKAANWVLKHQKLSKFDHPYEEATKEKIKRSRQENDDNESKKKN